MYKLFLKRIGIVVLLNLSLIIIFEYWLSGYKSNLLFKDQVLKKSIENFEKRTEDIDVLFLGNSEVYYGINPALIKIADFNVYNFGFPSETIGTRYYKIKYYLDRGYLSKLKLVVLLVDSKSMTDDPPLQFMFSNYWKYYDWRDIFLNNDIRITLEGFFMSMSSVRIENNLRPTPFSFLVKFFSSGLSRYDSTKLFENGLLLDNGYWFSLMDHSKDKDARLEANTNDVSNWDLKYYKRLIDLLENHHIKIIFIQLPVLYKQGVKGDVERRIPEIVRTNFPGILLLDYYGLSDSLPFNFYTDAGHLNYLGAQVLGKIMTNDLSLIVPTLLQNR